MRLHMVAVYRALYDAFETWHVKGLMSSSIFAIASHSDRGQEGCVSPKRN